MIDQKPKNANIQRIWGGMFVLSIIFLCLSLLILRFSIVKNVIVAIFPEESTPTPTATPTLAPGETPMPTPTEASFGFLEGQIQPNTGGGDLEIFAVIISGFATIVSLTGLISTTILDWRKEAREARVAKLEAIQLQLELEKTKLELEKLRKELESKKGKSDNRKTRASKETKQK